MTKPPSPAVVNGRKFDRHVQFDERSRNFPIRAAVPLQHRSYTWTVGITLDQGQEGACVGFGWAHELAAKPIIVKDITNQFAHDRIYKEAQKLDEWDGEDYSGTSVIAGAKVVKNQLKAMVEYRWAFGLEDLRLAVGHAGPAVLGVNWYEGMFNVDSGNFVHAIGQMSGGHCICCFGVNNRSKYFSLHNSWGESWGNGGNCKISFDDMDKLLHESGEACIPMGRRQFVVTL